MSRIPDEIVEQVRDAADLIELIGESVELKRTGTDYRGPCPFHGGTHRNFAVIPKKGIYYCYVCHEGGDAFTYLMKRFGMDYPSAVREVARRVGITVPERNERQGPDPREPLFGAVAVAQEWFASQLRESPEAKPARAYLEQRHWDLQAVVPLGLGYAPRGSAFLETARELGIEEDVLIEAGLVVRRDDGGTYPRFRGRLIFPIHDLRGRVVAFGGRIIGQGEPKYLNSPESEIFHKGRTLYNLHHAKQGIRQAECVILVEGYFDVLRLNQAGFDHVVAPLGTALTAEQAQLLKRYTSRAILLYDSDAAGLRATFRSADELLRHEFEVGVATLPAGEDPDSLVQSGGRAAMQTVLDDAIDVLERKVQILQRKGWFEGIEQRRRALDRLMPTVRAAKSSITKELYLTRLAELTGVAKEVLARDAQERVRQLLPQPVGHGGRVRVSRNKPDGAVAERDILTIIMHDPERLRRARKELSPELFETLPNKELFVILTSPDGDKFRQEIPSGSSVNVRELWSRLKAREPDIVSLDIDEMFEGAFERLVARPKVREYDEKTRQLVGTVDPQERERLEQDVARLKQEIEERFPTELNRRSFKKLAR